MTTADLPTASIELPPDDELGPKLRELKESSSMMALAAYAKIVTGATDKQCCRMAGYSAATEHSLESTAHRVFHDPRVIDALGEGTRHIRRAAGLDALRFLHGVVRNDKLKTDERTKAAKIIIDHTPDMALAHESRMTVEHRLSEDQLDARILQLARELGLSEHESRKLLIDNSRVIEGEFTEVAAANDPLLAPIMPGEFDNEA